MKRRELERILKRKLGLIPAEGSAHRLYFKKYRGQEIFQIPVSRTHTDINESIMGLMAGQCFLQLGQFKKSVDCTYSAQKFHVLTIQGWIKRYGTM